MALLPILYQMPQKLSGKNGKTLEIQHLQMIFIDSKLDLAYIVRLGIDLDLDLNPEIVDRVERK